MSKKLMATGSIIACLLLNVPVTKAQSIKEFVEKNGAEKIKESIIMGPGNEPTTAKGFGDGHGKNPLLTSKNQIPDTVALISLYIYDLGTNTISHGGHTTYLTYTSVSKNGGNILANEIYKHSIENLKAAFKKQGVVLLTPEEFLNTPEKRAYYNKNFTPDISKLGKFLSDLETKHNDIAVGADYFRVFDISAATDHLRSESLGGDLAKKLGVNGVLTIAIEIQSGNKEINMHGVKMSLHGPNPVAKEDKKYVAQNMGNGYYTGQLYAFGTYYFKKPIEVGSFKKKQIEDLNFEGSGVIMESFIDRFYETMNENMEKAAKKY